MMKKRIAYLFVAFLVMGLAACSGKKIDGTYYADFTSIKGKNSQQAKLAAAMMKLSLNFDGSDVTVNISIMGQTKSEKLQATYSGDEVTLKHPKDKGKEIVMVAKGSDRLECVKCPNGFPTVWTKTEPKK